MPVESAIASLAERVLHAGPASGIFVASWVVSRFVTAAQAGELSAITQLVEEAPLVVGFGLIMFGVLRHLEKKDTQHTEAVTTMTERHTQAMEEIARRDREARDETARLEREARSADSHRHEAAHESIVRAIRDVAGAPSNRGGSGGGGAA